MAQTQERVPGSPDAPSQSVSLARDAREDSFHQSKSQRARLLGPRERLFGAITSALAETAPADQALLLRWLGEKAILGVAVRQGLTEAAAFTYRMADTMAGATAS